MYDRIVEAVLMLGLMFPGGADAGPPGLYKAADRLPQEAKERIVRYATARGHFDPVTETPSWESFGGVYHILYRRMAGRPIPRHLGDHKGPVAR